MSSRTVLNFRPKIDLSCLIVSTSTVIFFPFLFFIAFWTKVFKSELAIWLSLIKYSSLKLNLWFVPPPILTAYFWITLKFGIVFRVQQILVFFPANLINWFVLVAIPEMWDKKFKATLSAIKIFFALPLIEATIEPFFIFEPSFFLIINLILLSIWEKECFANSNPAITAFWFDINFAVIILFSFIKLEI